MRVCIAIVRICLTAAASIWCTAVLAQDAGGSRPPLPEAPGEQAQPEIRIFDQWGVQCGATGQGGCIAFQNISTEDSQTPVMLVRVGYLPTNQGTRAAMEIVLPLGIYLKFGVAIEVDGEGIARDYFDHCARGGCFALFSFEDDIAQKFLSGSSGKVVFQDGTQETVEIPFSLDGFSDAFNELKG